MNTGKIICSALKNIRRNIAKENGISLDIPPCHYKGECSGTCPQCDHEIQQLESALAQKLSLGKIATVAGIALGLHATAQAAPNETPATPDSHQMRVASPKTDTLAICRHDTNFAIRVRVVDSATNEPIPYAELFLRAGKHWMLAGVTNKQGFISIHGGLADQEYELVAQDCRHFVHFCKTYFSARPSTKGDTMQVLIDEKKYDNKRYYDRYQLTWRHANESFIGIGGVQQVAFDNTPASYYQPPQVTVATNEPPVSDNISQNLKATTEMVMEMTNIDVERDEAYKTNFIGLKLVSADDLGVIPLARVRIWRRGKLIAEQYSNFSGIVEFKGLSRRKYTIEILSPYHPSFSAIFKAEPLTYPPFLHQVKIPSSHE